MFNSSATSYLVSINLVTHNGRRWLPYCLASIAQLENQDFFLLIVDNASLDGTVGLIRQFLKNNPSLAQRSRLIENRYNLGFARAHNQALAWTSGDFVLLLNQDVKLEANYLTELLKAINDDVACGSVSGKLDRWFLSVSEGGQSDDLSNRKVIDSAGLLIKRNRQVIDRGAGEMDKGQYNNAEKVFGVSGAAPLFRRQALSAVSLGHEVLDEDFVSYKEDVDLAWRLQRAGYNSLYVPTAVGYHDRSISLSRGWFNRWQQRRRQLVKLRAYSWSNHWFVLLKNDDGLNLMRDLPWWFSYELAKFFYLLLMETSVWWQGIVRIFKLLPRMIYKRRRLKSVRQRAAWQIRGWWLR